MSEYAFRPVAHADLDLLRRWRGRPHVVEYWGPAEDEDPGEVLADPRVAMWIVEHRGRPFAYAQDYSPHDWEPHPFAHLPPGSRGIDQYIGELDMVGIGHGSAFVRAHCDRLLASGAPAIGTDPHPDNRRAIRAYEKAGFAIVSGPLDTRWGRALLMERWR
ncbi:MAG TPA: GNAT family N-acetyltransferase [Allosphingosinicella sp.]|jgi:aminoglycoside 6'-N-acetyltransferase